MAQDINSVVLCGNLVRDCELKYTQSGMAIGNISIACNRSKKQADGQYVNDVSYFDIILFGRTAENLKQYLTQGKKIAVRGFLKQDRWKDQQSNNRSRVSVIAEELELLGGNENRQQNQPFSTAQAMIEADRPPQFVPQQNQQSNPFDIPFTEDIPF